MPKNYLVFTESHYIKFKITFKQKLLFKIHHKTCSRTELWSTFYKLNESYKLEQRSSQGSRHARQARAQQNLMNTNTCSIDSPQAHLRAQVGVQVCWPDSGSVKWKLETHKHIRYRCSTGATDLRTWHTFKHVT